MGERRAEGFGEVALDAPLLGNGLFRVAAQPPPPPATASEVPHPGVGAGLGRDPGEDGGLSDAERDALELLRRRAVATAARDRVIVLRRDGSPPAGYTALRAALAALSPSQRSTWLTLVNDAALRRTEGRLRGEIDRWLSHQGQGRQSQREAAHGLRTLLDGGVDALAGLGPLGPASRVEVLAVLVDDLVDELRRPPALPDGRNA